MITLEAFLMKFNKKHESVYFQVSSERWQPVNNLCMPQKNNISFFITIKLPF